MILSPFLLSRFNSGPSIKKHLPFSIPHYFFTLLLYSIRDKQIYDFKSAKNGLYHTFAPLRSYIFVFFIYHSSSPNSAANSSANPDRSTSSAFGDSSTSSAAAATSSTTAFFGSTRHRIVELTKLYSYA